LEPSSIKNKINIDLALVSEDQCFWQPSQIFSGGWGCVFKWRGIISNNYC